MKNISKEIWEKTIADNQPNVFIKLLYNTYGMDGWNFWKILLMLVFLVFNIAAIPLEHVNRFLFLSSLIIANGYLAVVVISSLIAIKLNNIRINRIQNELSITEAEYNQLNLVYGSKL